MADLPTNNEVGKVVELEEKEDVIIRFCGDSGDGMQLTGSRFTETTAIMGNDVSTLPDFPAEIRAPAGSLAGVSGYQIRFSSKDIRTPGDAPDVLVAMNPAALRTNLPDLKEGGMLIVNTDAFTQDNLDYAGYQSNPIEDGTLDAYASYKINLTTLTQNALDESPLTKKSKERCKNFFALGIMSWLYQRPMEPTLKWIETKFKGKEELIWANQKALKSGYYYSETAELFKKHYKIPKAELPQGQYRHITGNEATALGFVAAGQLAHKDLIYATYPITPASDILHELSKHKNFGVKTLQAEDEISAIGMAIGAAFTGAIGLTGTSGPGLSLKAEALGLALMMELPLVVINVQRGGPSTGLPTKTEQADLLQAMYGRHGESPVAILAPATPGECFYLAIEAVRLATKYMTPVIFLSDGYLANGAEPWAIPTMSEIEPIKIEHPKASEVHFYPYHRNPETLARPWAIPGTKGLEHRLGGLEKQEETGNVSYDPLNHDAMIKVRAKKIAGIVQDVPDLKVYGEDSGEVLLLGWGSTYGAITSAVDKLKNEGLSISSAHLRYLNPFPKNLGDVLSKFKRVIIPEMNQGQLVTLIRAKYLIDAIPINKTQGKPFKIAEITTAVKEITQKEKCGLMEKIMTEENKIAEQKLTKKDFMTSNDVRWCPGCGDYAILAFVQRVLPELGIPRENYVFVSGIGCSSRFPYYMNTYGLHTIHGRAPTIATGIKVTNPDLQVWVVTGDGDALSIGGNHLIHALRRNVDIKILLFNNRIYGLTKGQYSPTSELGKKTKSTPYGSVDLPLNPISIALGAEASFVARTVDTNPKHMAETLKRAALHKGSAYVEIFQNCIVFNDGAFKPVSDKEVRDDQSLFLEDGKPLIFGKENNKGIKLNGLTPEIVTIGENGVTEKDLLVHQEEKMDSTYAFMLSRLTYPNFPTPIGVFRSVNQPTYNELVNDQVEEVKKSKPADLQALVNGKLNWSI